MQSGRLDHAAVTLAVQGSQEALGRSAAAARSLQLDDLLTAHIAEFGEMQTALDGVRDRLRSGSAFAVQWNAGQRRAKLVRSAALLVLCPLELPSVSTSDRFPSSCMRRPEVISEHCGRFRDVGGDDSGGERGRVAD